MIAVQMLAISSAKQHPLTSSQSTSDDSLQSAIDLLVTACVTYQMNSGTSERYFGGIQKSQPLPP